MFTAAKSSSPSTGAPEPKIDIWLARWEKKRKCRLDSDKSKVQEKDNTTTEEKDTETLGTFSLPPNLPPLPDLPPSLLPPPPGGYPKLPKLEWS